MDVRRTERDVAREERMLRLTIEKRGEENTEVLKQNNGFFKPLAIYRRVTGKALQQQC
jgi:hypothetical protein